MSLFICVYLCMYVCVAGGGYKDVQSNLGELAWLKIAYL